jgi:large subunit ribosomal protein L18
MINQQKIKQTQAKRRHARVRAKIKGTAKRPRVSVFRSLKHIQAQLIDDSAGRTLAMANDQEIKSKDKPVAQAKAVGKLLAQKAGKLDVAEVVFDRSRFKYHGRVKALAEGLRAGGIKF